jgi:hypothetical protein
MIFDKRALLALGVASAAGPFSRVDAVRGYEKKHPLDTTARKLDAKAEKAANDESTSAAKEPSSTSKGGKNPPNSSEAHKESTPFFVASAACAQKCISAEFEPDHHLLMNAIQHCDAQSSRQMWHIVQDGTFVKVKSVDASADSNNGGWCIGVVPQETGLSAISCDSMYDIDDCESVPGCHWSGFPPGHCWGSNMDWFITPLGVTGDEDVCRNGNKLGLVSCDNPTAQWSSTDGQLISPFCWGIGHSSFLSVNEGCTDLHLSTTSDGATAISRSETFIAVTQDFVETIPPPPVPTYHPTYNPTTATSTPSGSPMEPTANPTTATSTPTGSPMEPTANPTTATYTPTSNPTQL